MSPASSSGNRAQDVLDPVSRETLNLFIRNISTGGIMKNVQRILSTVAVLATLVALTLVSVYSVAQDKKSTVPTRKELVTLLKTAKEPPEHRRIAAYYRQEAVRLTQSAKEHSELAAIYQERHPFAAMESKHGDAFGLGASHCEKFAQLAKEQAKEAEALAVIHEDMAKAAEQKQQ
jgi:hypothetical protein